MRLLRSTLTLGLLLVAACRPHPAAETEVEIVIVPGSSLTQKLAADAVVKMLASHAYANAVLRRLPQEDARLFQRETDLQTRLSVTSTPDGRRIRIAFTFPDRLVADRVVASYKACLVQNWVGDHKLEFDVRPVTETEPINRSRQRGNVSLCDRFLRRPEFPESGLVSDF